jgi:outer membrane protein OmpA-like peptidoglycan-associated protein
MNKHRMNLLPAIAVPLTLALAMSGCATRNYARKQVAPVHDKVTALEAQTNQKFAATDEKIAAVSSKEQTDISQVNERISTTNLKLQETDAKLAEVSGTAQQAQSSAARASEQANAASARLASETAAMKTGLANSLNYQLIEKADVTFGFNTAELTPQAKAALDLVASKIQATPLAVVELVGFTDAVGSKDYNVALSVKRAEAVERYLVKQRVALRAIHTVGLGEEAPPADLQADFSAVDPNASKSELNRLARRVNIRVFAAGGSAQAAPAGDGQH